MASPVFRVKSECRCGRVLDMVGDPSAAVARGPQQGDTTVCMYCYAVLTFDGDHFRPMSDTELAMLSSDELANIAHVRKLILRSQPKATVQ